ncbi:hypothetical protein A9Z06_24490 [Rhizobium sp. YK2]|nr:hypothetical protein A9Z06_24490 [Rhizobium sp. YK2]
MEMFSGSEVLAPLPLNKLAHIDDEAALRKSTVVLKNSHRGRASKNPALNPLISPGAASFDHL